ncbi:LRP2-binding protein-like isoform X1 [Paramacrobiotus metropolitanus]|uniref:LRP2-binding protein-like isoform X1 n=1 Tax=Paramacrobiotus metropolitanus TaxID=2943436 RepID=UPI002445CE0A|nr:LRP2-binding protein-like isoform X1 [Paramacrobiotus metropolitanus]
MMQRVSPVQKNFGLADDELIRHLMLQSGVYKPLSRDDVRLDTDNLDSSQVDNQTVTDNQTNPEFHINQQFKEALSLYESKDFENAYHLFEELADKGLIPGLYYQAIMIYDGKGAEENAAVGFALMQKVYEMSLISPVDVEFRHLACYHLGNACAQGYGTSRSEELAVSWWQRAANEILFDPHKNVEKQVVTDAGVLCQTAMGSYYSRCSKPEGADYTKAFYWHSEAARNGNISSVAQMGMFYLYGLGCQKSSALAHEHLLLAGTRNNICAIGHIALYYLENNMAESAYSWAVRAADIVGNLKGLDAGKVDTIIRQVTSSSANRGDEEDTKRSLAMSLFILGYLYETGRDCVARGRYTAADYYSAASKIDLDAVLFLGNRLKLGRSA